MSMKTALGWQKVPSMFFADGTSTPVFPPMLLST